MVSEKKEKRKYKQNTFSVFQNSPHLSQHSFNNRYEASGACQQRPFQELIAVTLLHFGCSTHLQNVPIHDLFQAEKQKEIRKRQWIISVIHDRLDFHKRCTICRRVSRPSRCKRYHDRFLDTPKRKICNKWYKKYRIQ